MRKTKKQQLIDNRQAQRQAQIHEQIANAEESCDLEKLPPNDPDYPDEDFNEKRSGWAEEAILAFVEATGSDLEDAVGDLIGDLGHFCDRHGLNMRNEITRGEEYYRYETQEKGKAFEDED